MEIGKLIDENGKKRDYVKASEHALAVVGYKPKGRKCWVCGKTYHGSGIDHCKKHPACMAKVRAHCIANGKSTDHLDG